MSRASTGASQPLTAGESSTLDFYSQEFEPTAASPERLRQHIAEWFFAAKNLRRFEQQRLANNATAEDLELHLQVCEALIRFGQFARSAKVDLSVMGTTSESIDAEIDLLQLSIRMYHERSQAPDQAKADLEKLFA